MRLRKLTSGVRYLWSKSSKDASSPAFTSIINWTSDLAIASTFYRTRCELKSCPCRVLPAPLAGFLPRCGRRAGENEMDSSQLLGLLGLVGVLDNSKNDAFDRGVTRFKVN